VCVCVCVCVRVCACVRVCVYVCAVRTDTCRRIISTVAIILISLLYDNVDNFYVNDAIQKIK